MKLDCCTILTIVAFIVCFSTLCPPGVVDATLSKSDKKDKKAKKKQSHSQKSAQQPIKNVMDRNLVTKIHKASDVLKEHDKYCELEREVRHFTGPVLAYVTPWNSKGYDIAKLFHKKFTMISPVWLQVKAKQNKYTITGTHDIDKNWAKEVTRGGDNSLVPRVLFDGWNLNDYKTMFGNENLINKCAKAITNAIKNNNFAGVTLELWSQIPAIPSLQSDLTHFLIHLSDQLHAAKKLVILVVPPENVGHIGSASFTSSNFQELKSSIDYFSVMTYDYQNQVGSAAPVSPIEWVEKSIRLLIPDNKPEDRAKLLLGINFYGIQFGHSIGARPIINHEFIQVLKSENPTVQWHAQDAEHSYDYKDSSGMNIMAFYPSLLFVQSRLDLARRLGTGVAIWEIGQGLDYFYDLL